VEPLISVINLKRGGSMGLSLKNRKSGKFRYVYEFYSGKRAKGEKRVKTKGKKRSEGNKEGVSFDYVENFDKCIRARNSVLRESRVEPENIMARATRVWSMCKELGMNFTGPDEEAINELASQLLE
jgi:hypothetical protein